MIIFILTIGISASGYFTYGDFSDGAQSYSLATYWTFEYKKNYLLFAYDNFSEQGSLFLPKQNLISLGYAKELLYSLGLREIGFYIFDSDNNVSGILSTRVLYGYNPIFTLGYATSSYSKQWESGRKFYTVHQITPECRIVILKKLRIVTSPCYINAGGEKYLSISNSAGFDMGRRLNIELGGMIGERFYYIDDKLLLVNNRPNVERGRACVKLNFLLTNNVKLVLDLERDSFATYNINYYALGLKIEL